MRSDWRGMAPEILDTIFSFSEEKDAARSARVCKSWMEIAFDHAWFDMDEDGFIWLCEVLAPLRDLREVEISGKIKTEVEFSRPITHSDWDRFFYYARRVKSLYVYSSFDEVDEDTCRILSKSSLAEILLTKPDYQPLLPRLRELQVVGVLENEVFPWLQLSIHLLQVSLKTIMVVFPLGSPHASARFVEEISRRARNVEKLDFLVRGTTLDAVELDALPRLFPTMQKLTRVSFSSRLFSPALLSSLQGCANLETIDVSSDSLYLNGVTLPFGRLPESLMPDAFPSLTSLKLICSLEEWNRMMSCGECIAPNLCHLQIDVVSLNDASTFRTSLGLIGKSFPSLQSLGFIRRSDASVVRGLGGDSSNAFLNAKDLSPLAYMKKLNSFKLCYIEPVTMRNEDLAALLGNLSCLEVFELHPSPVHLHPTELNLNLIPMLRQTCPRLHRAILYLDATDIQSASSPSLDYSGNLSCIGFKTSPVRKADVHKIMVFLSQVLPENCKMEHERYLETRFVGVIDASQWKRMEEYRLVWENMAELLPLVMEVRRVSAMRANCTTKGSTMNT
ncbi:hypothetical protein SCHPADRAFT_927960 [Schizopora paradoxa]|uniref:F-box domain-containing protein n=1 Tax=Schizopora paradoxa TaxID=27342 RepID=A0A0H2RRK0_9AGAM|nr:hypothetical protein SCHPADRAFT_927960 [Schizopora paradoxa]